MPPTAIEQRSARFDALFSETHGPLVGYVLRRGASRADMEDIVAEVYVVAWRRFDDIPWADPLPWLIGVARNVHRNLQRKRQRGDALLERLRRERPPGDASTTAGSDDNASIRRALAALRESDREILQLAAVEGLLPAQIAQVLGCQPVTARVRLHRARRRLRALLESAANEGAADARVAPTRSERRGA